MTRTRKTLLAFLLASLFIAAGLFLGGCQSTASATDPMPIEYYD